ncbi:MAG TPA: ECF-type sigma factor [Bryobacteraceae bacterium]|nr:ECF-type sigma factor [Bryobacteraceae bacterium]
MELKKASENGFGGELLNGTTPAYANVPKLIQTVYPELRRIARVLMLGERKNHTLIPTSLVHEALLQLLGLDRIRVNDGHHLLVLAANQMRWVLTSYARKRMAQKRLGLHNFERAEPVELVNIEQVAILDQVLDRLATADPRAHQVVVLRYFAGLTEGEISVALGVSERTVRRDWEFARIWLFGELSAE